ncbi:uncharacterized protein CTRU02_205522 [Colletotrichum truncatum]|uniref:Uncharacterized protein n=1 Tax=Colletotrichum truncatum TaxID=5467 RepID=A0ACC3Z497_COLTU
MSGAQVIAFLAWMDPAHHPWVAGVLHSAFSLHLNAALRTLFAFSHV